MPSVKKFFCAAHTSRVRSYILLTWRQDIYINYVEFFYMGDWTILLIDALNHSFIPVWINEYSFYNVDYNPVLPSVLWYSSCSSFHVHEKWLILALGQETYPISLETLVLQVNAVRTTKPHSDACVFRGTARGIVKELPDFQAPWIFSLSQLLEVSPLYEAQSWVLSWEAT